MFLFNEFVSFMLGTVPELKTESGIWSAAGKLKALYDYFCGIPSAQTVNAVYVWVKCYVPASQPTPLEVIYSKYVVEYYFDSSFTMLYTTDVYY